MRQEYIGITDLAKVLGISRQAMLKQVQGKINAGEIEVRTEGKKYLIKYSTLPQDIRERFEAETKEVAKQLASIPKKDLDFEKELWAAADKLRGNVDPSEYKYIVLGLIFLKFVSDSFYQQREELQKSMKDSSNKEYYLPDEKAREKMLEDKEMYKRESIFYIPEVSRWEFLRSKASLPNIAEYIERAMEAIERDIPEQLSGVLPTNFVRLPLESHVIGELVNIFSRIKFDHAQEKEKDMLGRVYEYFIGQFADAEGKRGGAFFTPRPIVKLLVEILEPFENSRVFDPCAGSGGMFVQSSNFLKEHHKNPPSVYLWNRKGFGFFLQHSLEDRKKFSECD